MIYAFVALIAASISSCGSSLITSTCDPMLLLPIHPSISVLVFAKEHISFSANKSIHFDTGGTPNDPGDSYFIINSPKIVLGLKNNNKLPTEPVLLGERTEEFLKDVLAAIDALCDIIDGPEHIDSAGDVPSPTLVAAIKTFRNDHIKRLASEIGYSYKPDEDFKHKVDTSIISSKHVFTI